MDTNLLHNEIRPGISLFTAVKNRPEHLDATLATWVLHDDIDEIIIVDWDSTESVLPIIRKHQNGKIYLAVVKDEPKWILSQAFNLAARLTSRNKLLKIDADVQVLPEFFHVHRLVPGMFFSGNWRTARDENESHLNGNLFLFRDDFFNVNGYNEYIRTYGWDDSDLFDRLIQSGLRREDFNFDTLHHLNHSERTINQRSSASSDAISDEEWARQNIFINRFLTSNIAKWTPDLEMHRFDVERMEANIFLCADHGIDPYIIPSEWYKKGEHEAMAFRLAELGLQLNETVLENLDYDEITAIYRLALSAETTSVHTFNVIKKINALYNKSVGT